VSYAGVEEETAMDIGGIRRLYALICLSELFAVESVSGIPYQSVSSAFSSKFLLVFINHVDFDLRSSHASPFGVGP
jgi:hypothetical protein